MQSLRDYLNHTRQCESILDPNQDQVMDRMTDDMIRPRIREYCTYSLSKQRGEYWPAAESDLQITKVDKDEKGWYIETMSKYVFPVTHTNAKSFYEYCLSKGQKIDKQKGFLIEDAGIYFRWRKHKGAAGIFEAPYFESTEGLPEELDVLDCTNCFQKSKKLTIRNSITIVVVSIEGDLKISGNGCKNVIIHPDGRTGNVTVPSQTKILRPKTEEEYWDLRKKIIGH